jgi:hypothetical protein
MGMHECAFYRAKPRSAENDKSVLAANQFALVLFFFIAFHQQQAGK